MPAVLSREDIHELLKAQPPLVEDYLDLSQQVQPNGFDLTLREVALLEGTGNIGVENSERRLPGLATMVFDGLGNIELIPGAYLITYNEIVHLPSNLMALARPRSSLLRCGVAIHTAVWDAGYSGRSQSLMVVYNQSGFRLQRNARVTQLIFLRLSHETEGYKGIYQGENT